MVVICSKCQEFVLRLRIAETNSNHDAFSRLYNYHKLWVCFWKCSESVRSRLIWKVCRRFLRVRLFEIEGFWIPHHRTIIWETKTYWIFLSDMSNKNLIWYKFTIHRYKAIKIILIEHIILHLFHMLISYS